jgi:ABC-2 type transport system ATP-binding protein/lipopolysaccharide transport system ATP-binding protein
MARVILQDVHVSFPVYSGRTRSLKNKLFSAGAGGAIDETASGVTLVKALDGVDLVLDHGDRIALVGHNGAGKSTLLRVLAGVCEPSRGTVAIDGSVVPIFNIELGMDPEATGFENIILRGLFLGMTKAQINERMADIAEFTELGDFLHLPLRTYSDGMRMRLAFAVSTAIDPDILILDEGIGAGDAHFIDRASRRLSEFTSRAAIIVLASHSEGLVASMCNKAALLERGRIIKVGEVQEVLQQYRSRKR